MSMFWVYAAMALDSVSKPERFADMTLCAYLEDRNLLK